MLPVSEVILAQRSSAQDKWILYDIYKMAPNHKLEVHLFGWIEVAQQTFKQFEIIEEYFRTLARRDMEGLKLLCGSTVIQTQVFVPVLNVF